MRERLVFPSQAEQKAALELISTTFPLAVLWELPQPSMDIFTSELEITDLDKETFFEWAIQAIVQPPGLSESAVIFYCLDLSLELISLPPWMRNIFIKVKFADGKNLLAE